MSDKEQNSNAERVNQCVYCSVIGIGKVNWHCYCPIIGIGEGTSEIIEEVKTYVCENLSVPVITWNFECDPTQLGDMELLGRMVLIVARDNQELANCVAKKCHKAGMLTLGLLQGADLNCYDSVLSGAGYTDYAEIIKEVLQTLFGEIINAFDLYDICTTLRNTKHFIVRSTKGYGSDGLQEAFDSMKEMLTSFQPRKIERMSILVYRSKLMYRLRRDYGLLSEGEGQMLNNFVKGLSEDIDEIWAMGLDENLKADEVKVSIIASGEGLDNG